MKERPKTAARARGGTATGDGADDMPAQRPEPFLMDEESRKRRQEELQEQLRAFEEVRARAAPPGWPTTQRGGCGAARARAPPQQQPAMRA